MVDDLSMRTYPQFTSNLLEIYESMFTRDIKLKFSFFTVALILAT